MRKLDSNRIKHVAPPNAALGNEPSRQSALSYAEGIVRQLVEAHHTAYFAGGCVRDQLLGISPQDFDIATSANPDQVQSLFGRNRTLFVGLSFGVVCVHARINGTRHQVEIATFRIDGTYSDGRHPDSVQFSDAQHDALRRDFTINGLFFDPIAQQVIDFVGGVDDLNHGIVRAIGNPEDRFREDKLRMMRAIRFAARFGFQIERNTERAIGKMSESIRVVSPERIATELRNILPLDQRVWGASKLWETGLWREVFPMIDDDWRIDQHRSAALQLLGTISPADFVLSIAALIYDLASRNVGGVRWLASQLKHRWKLSNTETDGIVFVLEMAPVILSASTLRWSKVQPVLTDPRASQAIDFSEAVAVRDGLATEGIERCRAASALPCLQLNPPPLIHGHDLKLAGLKPGPRFSDLLSAVRAKQLDGELQDSKSALDWIRSLIDRGT